MKQTMKCLIITSKLNHMTQDNPNKQHINKNEYALPKLESPHIMQSRNHFLFHRQNQQTSPSGFEIPFPSPPTNWPHNS
jgi:hypothetical protein